MDHFALGGMLAFVHTVDRLAPIEVKATNGTAKSLRTLIESDAYPDIDWGGSSCAAATSAARAPY